MKVTLPPLHPAQQQVVFDMRRPEHKYGVLISGRRFGKTFLSVVYALGTALEKSDANVWWVAPTYDSSKIGLEGFLRLTKQIPDTQYTKFDQTIMVPNRHKNTSTITIKSAGSRSATLRGQALDLVVVDEAAYLSKPQATIFQELIPSLLDRRGKLLMISTHERVARWIYDLWLRGQNTDDVEWVSWNYSTLDNPYIAQEEITKLKNVLSERQYRVEILGEFDLTQGLVYDTFDPDVHVSARAEYIHGQPVYWAVDDGYAYGAGVGTTTYHPRVILFFHLLPDGSVYVFDEYYATRETYTETLINVSRKPYPTAQVAWVDSSAAVLRGELYNRGVMVFKGTHTKEEGIKVVRQFLDHPDHRDTAYLLINPRCKSLIEEFKTYTYDISKEDKLVPVKADDHGLDALRYALWHLRTYLRAEDFDRIT